MAWWKTKRKPQMHVGTCSDTGRVRTENEDAWGAFSPSDQTDTDEHLFVVADGMGGHIRGREASHTAVEVVQQTFFAMQDQPVNQRLRKAFEAANERIYHSVDGRSSETMGTTCTVVALVGGRVHVAHAGDSRAYRIHDRRIQQLTEDHTVVEKLLREGVLTAAEAETHPRRHTLTRAMGTEAELDVDLVDPIRVEPPDHYLLCTDGLAQVTPEEIREVVLSHPPQEACDQLVRMANDRGGADNVTVVLVAFE